MKKRLEIVPRIRAYKRVGLACDGSALVPIGESQIVGDSQTEVTRVFFHSVTTPSGIACEYLEDSPIVGPFCTWKKTSCRPCAMATSK